MILSQQIPSFVDQTLLNQEESYLYEPAAERGFLACIMQRPQLLMEAQRVITPAMLNIDMHRYIYQIMIFVERQAIIHNWQLSFDEIMVLAIAKQAGPQFVDSFYKKNGLEKWREIAGFAQNCSVERFPQYVDTIRDRGSRVKMFRMARQMQRSSMDMQANPQVAGLAASYEGELSRISFNSADDDESRMTKLGQYAQPILDKALMSQQNPHLHLFHVRHPRFQRWMDLMGGGFRRNSLTIIAARAKVGKTTLLLNLAMDFALAGIPVLFLDTEMSGEEMTSRQLSNIADINEYDLLKGHFLNSGEDAEKARVLQGVQNLGNAPFYYSRIAGKPIEYGVSMMRQFRNQIVGVEPLTFQGNVHQVTRPGVIFYDWLKLPAGSSQSDNAKEYQLLGDLCSMIKDAAKNLNLPVIAGAQQNRAGVGKDEADHQENAESYISGSDRLAMFCSTLCTLRNPSAKLADDIEAAFGAGTQFARPGKEESQAWLFNQVFQIILQRQGRECRYGLPFYIDRGHARYEEVSTPEATSFLRDYSKARKEARKVVAAGVHAHPVQQPVRTTPPAHPLPPGAQ